MPSITFIAHDGSTQQVDADTGSSLMQAAVGHGVSGIIGDCGGSCACATCHCYVDDAWMAKIPASDSGEQAMLDCVIALASNSRLACQIKMTDELDGLIVRLPASQY